MSHLAADLRAALRALVRHRGYALIAIVTAALGVGLHVALFSVVHALLFLPLPYARPGQPVWITNMCESFHAEIVRGADYLDWRDQSRTLASLAAFDGPSGVMIQRPNGPERVLGARASSTFFTTLGVGPAAGRPFVKADERIGAPKVAIVSDALWRRLFGDGVAVNNQTIRVESDLLTIVGVLPRGFLFPRSPDVDIVQPLVLDEAIERGRQRMTILKSLGRLNDGVTLAQSRAELRTIQREGEKRADEARQTAQAQ